MQQYMLINKIGEGAFSEVLKSQSLKTGNTVAIKCMKSQFPNIEQVQRLREIQALKKLSPHPHIVKLIEVLYDEPTGRLALVFELMDQNLFDTINHRKSYLHPSKVKYYMFQVLKAIDHMHKNGIFHRDIKPENILIRNDHIKVADLGSCKGIHSQHPYTEYISTRWYRAPECLMTDGYYDYKMDLWGVGAVMFEIISLFPLFPGDNELDQVHKIHNILGTPDPRVIENFQKHATHMEFDFPPKRGTGLEKLLPNASKDCIDLLYKLLTYDPSKRISAEEALRHEYFKEFNAAELNSTFSSLKLSPSSVVYRKSLDPQPHQMGNFTLTQKGMATVNPYLQKPKKQKQKPKNKQSGLQGIKFDVRIDGFQASEEERDQRVQLVQEFQLPPIKNETKINFNLTLRPEKKVPHLPNPYKKKTQKILPDYMVLGRKANFN